MRRLSIMLIGLVWLMGCGSGERPVTEAEAREAVEAWRQARYEDLRRPDGWLTLVGLYWLAEGANSFGSDAVNALVFPEGAPPQMGAFYLVGDSVRMEAAPGVEILHEDVPVDSVSMDPGGETASVVLAWGSLRWFAIKRDHGVGIRLIDTAHPALAAFDGIDAFPVDLGWRKAARFERYDPPRTVHIPTVMGTSAENTVAGAVVFEAGGQAYRLDAVGQPADSAFFVIFADATNGAETYSGGRYLWVDAPDAAGRLVADFNRAYNPPCVFTPYATCPLPPPQNRLALRVEAGEMNYK